MGFLKKIARVFDNFVVRCDRLLVGVIRKFMHGLRAATSQSAAVRMLRWLVAELKAMGKDLDDLILIVDQEVMETIADLLQIARTLRTIA